MSPVTIKALLTIGYYGAAVCSACSLGAAARTNEPRRSLGFTAMTIAWALVAVWLLRLYFEV